MRQQGAKRGKKHAAEAAGRRARRGERAIAAVATLGAVGVGLTLLEAAALPAIALGGAAVLAPRLWRELRKRSEAASVASPASPTPSSDAETRLISLPGFKMKQALAKTITYRVIITACDFSWNYVILGEAATAAGLSTVSLAAGPFSYFMHEALWNRYGARFTKNGRVTVPVPRVGSKSGGPQEKGAIVVERSIAKTVTFRTIGTVMEFATNYAFVQDAATAAVLSAFGFVLGPFIYLGHEKAWELADGPKAKAPAPSVPPAESLPAPPRLAAVSA